MILTNDEARKWLATHETAFNSGEWEPVMDDYADGCVLEVHMDGVVHLFTGKAAIRPALEMGSSSGIQTKVVRVATDDGVIAAQICDEHGATFMTSFWHVDHGRITRDVSILCRSAPSPA